MVLVHVHRTVVRCVIRDLLRYIPVRDYGIRKFKNKLLKSCTLKLTLEAGKPGGSNRSRVSNTSRISSGNRESDSIVHLFQWRREREAWRREHAPRAALCRERHSEGRKYGNLKFGRFWCIFGASLTALQTVILHPLTRPNTPLVLGPHALAVSAHKAVCTPRNLHR